TPSRVHNGLLYSVSQFLDPDRDLPCAADLRQMGCIQAESSGYTYCKNSLARVETSSADADPFMVRTGRPAPGFMRIPAARPNRLGKKPIRGSETISQGLKPETFSALTHG